MAMNDATKVAQRMNEFVSANFTTRDSENLSEFLADYFTDGNHLLSMFMLTECSNLLC